jgi:hypothetical protein
MMINTKKKFSSLHDLRAFREAGHTQRRVSRKLSNRRHQTVAIQCFWCCPRAALDIILGGVHIGTSQPSSRLMMVKTTPCRK